MNQGSPTTLYRLFNVDGDLLYVGIAGNPGRRFEQHAADKPWWTEVAEAKLEHFRDRPEAQDAERVAIQTERPFHNVCHMAGRGFRAWLLTQTRRPGIIGHLAHDVRHDPDFPRSGGLDDFLAHVGYGDASDAVRAAWDEWMRP